MCALSTMSKMSDEYNNSLVQRVQWITSTRNWKNNMSIMSNEYSK